MKYGECRICGEEAREENTICDKCLGRELEDAESNTFEGDYE